MQTGETPEERKAREAQMILGDLVGKNLSLQIDERLAYERGDNETASAMRTRRSELAVKILEAQEEYLSREITAQEVHRKLMHEILDSQGVPPIHGLREGIDREIDERIETARVQLKQTRDRKNRR